LSAGHARALLALDEEDLIVAAAKQCVEEELSVRATETLVKKLKTVPKTKVQKAPFKATFESEVALALSEQMGRRVKATRGKKGGTLVIEYFDEADLQSLAKALAGEG